MGRWVMFPSCRSGSLCHYCCCTWSHVNHHMYLSMHLSYVQQLFQLLVLIACHFASALLRAPSFCPNTDVPKQWHSIIATELLSRTFHLWCHQKHAHLTTMPPAFGESAILWSTNVAISSDILRKKCCMLHLPFCNVLWQTHETMTPALVTDIEHVFARCRTCLSQQKATTSWRTTTMSENNGRRLWMDCRRVPRIHQFKPRGLSWLCETIAECLVPTMNDGKSSLLLRKRTGCSDVEHPDDPWMTHCFYECGRGFPSRHALCTHAIQCSGRRCAILSDPRNALSWLPGRMSVHCRGEAAHAFGVSEMRGAILVGRWDCDAVRRRAHDQMRICGEAAALVTLGARLDFFRNGPLVTVAIICQRTTVQNVKTWCSEGWPHVWVFLLRFPIFRPTRAIFLGDVSPAVELALYWLQLSPLVRRCFSDVVQFCGSSKVHLYAYDPQIASLLVVTRGEPPVANWRIPCFTNQRALEIHEYMQLELFCHVVAALCCVSAFDLHLTIGECVPDMCVPRASSCPPYGLCHPYTPRLQRVIPRLLPKVRWWWRFRVVNSSPSHPRRQASRCPVISLWVRAAWPQMAMSGQYDWSSR